MSELIIEHDTEFHGFLTGADVMTAARIVESLRAEAICAIHSGELECEVVEEIVRREGTFYTGTEAKPLVPWDMIYTNLCAASCKWLDDEPRPKSPAFAECNWLVIDPAQYMYGKYLQTKIERGELSIEDIKPREREKKEISF